jgi:undecaprenyl-diphosphatase
LGAVQGLTEFLPVSSSGHLVLVEHWLDTQTSDLTFEILVHMATLCVVLLHYRHDVLGLLHFWAEPMWKSGRALDPRWGLSVSLALGTAATGVVGFLLLDFAKGLFGKPQIVGGMLLVTAALLASTLITRRGREGAVAIAPTLAILIGVVQGLATIPGISRSGSTIAVALLVGIARPEAARFSFLLSIPAILAALLVTLLDVDEITLGAGAMVTGFVCAAVVGHFALVALVQFVNRGRLAWFAPYCAALGIAVMLWA